MEEPQIWDRFQVSVTLSGGDMCLVEYAIKKELMCCQKAADAGEEHAKLRCKWYADILSIVRKAEHAGEQAYEAAWDAYERAWNGEPEPAAESA